MIRNSKCFAPTGISPLYPKEPKFIKVFSKTHLKDVFFLTGGTALSEFYLQHRISEDLDFFTEEEGQIALVLPVINNITSELGGKLEIRRNFRSYVEFFITGGNG